MYVHKFFLRAENIVVILEILKDKKQDDKFLYIPNDDKQNHPFCRMNLQLKDLNTSSLEASKQYRHRDILLLYYKDKLAYQNLCNPCIFNSFNSSSNKVIEMLRFEILP